MDFIRTSKEMTERVHAYGSKMFLMMSAGFGRVTIPTNLGEFPPVAPSAIPHRWLDKTCRPLTKEEIRSIVKSFGDGAYNAKRGGFDGVAIHAVHEGYLLDQFAISMFNPVSYTHLDVYKRQGVLLPRGVFRDGETAGELWLLGEETD